MEMFSESLRDKHAYLKLFSSQKCATYETEAPISIPSKFQNENLPSSTTSKDLIKQFDSTMLCNMTIPISEILQATAHNSNAANKRIKKFHKQNRLYGIIGNMLKSRLFPNIMVKIGNSSFFCHLMVLQVYSPIFRSLTNELVIHLPKSRVTPDAFAVIYEWMVEEKPQIPRNLILVVFKGALFLKIYSLINHCWWYFDNTKYFIEHSAFLLYLETQNLIDIESKSPCQIKALRNLLLSRVNKFFLVLVASSEFVHLNLEELCEILNSNLIGVHCELEVFLSAIRWINFDWDNRIKHLLEVMKCIRFGLLQPWFSLALQKYANCEVFTRLMQQQDMTEKFVEAVAYAHIVFFYGNSPEILNSFNIKMYSERHWVIDRENSQYYDEFVYAMKNDAQYKHFEKYITHIQKRAVNFWQSLKYTDEDNVFLKL